MKFEITDVKFTVTDEELLSKWIMTNYAEAKAGKEYWESIENWAALMEARFDAGENPEDFVEKTFAEADKRQISFYHTAKLLIKVWKYGPELQAWWCKHLDEEVTE